MAHCTKCGAEVTADSRFCPVCGQPQSGAAPAPAPAVGNPGSQTSGLSENVAALLSYVLGWLTGIIFYLIDRRPYVRFHAMQSIVTFGGLHIIRIILGAVFGFGLWMGGMHVGFGLGWVLFSVIGLLTFVLWIVCMIKAYQGVRFKVPIAGDIAENAVGR